MCGTLELHNCLPSVFYPPPISFSFVHLVNDSRTYVDLSNPGTVEKKPHQSKKNVFVWTKESKLKEFPGVNATLKS